MLATITASTRRPDYGMSCVQCGDSLIAPESVEYFDEKRLVLNFWTCTNCGYQFGTEAFVPANTDSVSDEFAIRAFFPSLLVA